MRLKSDSAEFENTIDKLVEGEITTYLPSRKQKLLPRFVYHFTHMGNAVNILKEGAILSRHKANESCLMTVDNASGDVLSHTNERWKTYVRFYFRPKTPTQYSNEGIRSKSNMNDLNAHCPVPVFFLFDSKEMLTREDSKFSYGNLAVTNEAFSDSDKFKEMPFRYIYHEGSYDPNNEYFIKNNRHAELIIPNECSLDSLKVILCRSAAEKETFLNSLDIHTWSKYKDIVHVDTRNDFFYGQYTYVEDANLTKDNIVLNINKGRNNPIFDAYLEILEDSSKIKYTWRNEEYSPVQNQSFSLVNLKDSTRYTVKFFLDKRLAYHGEFMDEDYLPF